MEDLQMGIQIKLAHSSNPDIDGGYWDEPVDTGKPVFVAVMDVPEASRIAREYIDRNHLGGGNWVGGQMFLMLGNKKKEFGRISFNGRAWDLSGKEIKT
jgi:hypothetical protein